MRQFVVFPDGERFCLPFLLAESDRSGGNVTVVAGAEQDKAVPVVSVHRCETAEFFVPVTAAFSKIGVPVPANFFPVDQALHGNSADGIRNHLRLTAAGQRTVGMDKVLPICQNQDRDFADRRTHKTEFVLLRESKFRGSAHGLAHEHACPILFGLSLIRHDGQAELRVLPGKHADRMRIIHRFFSLPDIATA